MASDSTRRSFLQLLGGVLGAATVPASVAAEFLKNAPAHSVRDDVPDPRNPLGFEKVGSVDYMAWTITDKLTIEPGKVTDVQLFSGQGNWPKTLCVRSLGWAWREDTTLADCRKLLGFQKEDPEDLGLCLRLTMNGHDLFSARGAYVGGFNPMGWPIYPPIGLIGEFAMHVIAPALDLANPVECQFYIGGAIAVAEWLSGGVPVPPA